MGENEEDYSNKPVGMILHAVLRFLNTELRPVSPEEIKEKLNVDILTNPELLANIRTNPKVLREPDGRWRWKSTYYLRNKADLLSLIRRSPTGINVNELTDSYKGVLHDIQELKSCTPPEIVSLKHSSTSKEILYYYDPSVYLYVSEDIKEKFISIRVPDAVDVHRYLVAHGLKSSENTEQPQLMQTIVRKRPKAQSNRKANRRVKLTNVHMEGTGIDLTQDVDLGKGNSAFKK